MDILEEKQVLLKFYNNSCYVDTLLLSLFNDKNPFIEKLLFKCSVNEFIIGEKHNQKYLYDIGIQIQDILKEIYRNYHN